MKQDLLFEIGCEEIPAKLLTSLAEQLLALFIAELNTAGIQFESSQWFATPRRLAFILKNVATEQPDQKIERRGPAVSAAYINSDPTQPAPALQGFLKSCGVTLDQTQTEKTPKGEWIVYRGITAGQKTVELLAQFIKTSFKKLAIGKPMRWGSHKETFIRPVRWLVFLFGDDIIPLTLLGRESGRISYGHRFMAPEVIEIKHPTEYESKLEAGRVIADFEKRKTKIEEKNSELLVGIGLTNSPPEEGCPSVWVVDLKGSHYESLLNEVCGLIEWPVPLLCHFDEAFLKVPPEALIASMVGHQKCFPVFLNQPPRQPSAATPPLEGNFSKLLPYFIAVSNIESRDPQEVIKGNEKVMRARLSDAKFFYEEDLKHLFFNSLREEKDTLNSPPEEGCPKGGVVEIDLIPSPETGEGARRADEGKRISTTPSRSACHPSSGGEFSSYHTNLLAKITWQQGLGSLSDKSCRLAELASFIFELIEPTQTEKQKSEKLCVQQAAALCKFDLVTNMVGEFPELQGVMGSYYVKATSQLLQRGEFMIGDAIANHYKPRFSGDAVMMDKVSAAVALADKIDTLVGLFGINQKPTGEKDPYGLRRAALGVVRIVLENKLVFSDEKNFLVKFNNIILKAKNIFEQQKIILANEKLETDLVEFVFERLRFYYKDQAVNPELFEAIYAAQQNKNISDFQWRLEALQLFLKTSEALNLIVANKRAKNILEAVVDPIDGSIDRDRLIEPAEKILLDAIEKANLPIVTTGSKMAESTEYYQRILGQLATLKLPLDNFFEAVMVMIDDPLLRQNRLLILKKLRKLFLRVADFSLLSS